MKLRKEAVQEFKRICSEEFKENVSVFQNLDFGVGMSRQLGASPARREALPLRK